MFAIILNVYGQTDKYKHKAWDAEIRYTAEATGKRSTTAATCDAVRSEEEFILKNILGLKLSHTHTQSPSIKQMYVFLCLHTK